MKKVLIITVGGTFEPIVDSIKDLKPDFIYFLCSGGKDPKKSSKFQVNGPGKPCKKYIKERCQKEGCGETIEKEVGSPNILEQTNYKGKYKIIELNDPDNFDEVYKKIKETIEKAKKMGYEICADYTGGTKTMSSALAVLSSLDFEIKPFLVKGKRDDVIRTSGLSSVLNIENQVNSARADFLLKTIEKLIEKNLYYSALEMIKFLLQKQLPEEIQRVLKEKKDICEGFFYWNNFQYENAYEILKNYASNFRKEFEFLLKILGKCKGSGYEPVFDLISNAKRQAENGFYDNAIARLYRALELFAQIRLKKEYQIETNHLEKSLIKLKNKDKWEKKKNEEGEIKIGVNDDYELLFELDDPMGKVYMENKNKFIDKLKLRNDSKLAHGDIPIDEAKWNEFLKFFEEFIERVCGDLKIKKEFVEIPKKI